MALGREMTPRLRDEAGAELGRVAATPAQPRCARHRHAVVVDARRSGDHLRGAVALLAIGWLRRKEPGLPLLGENERVNVGLVVLFGIVIPIVILVALFVVSDLVLIGRTDAPKAGATAMTVTVIGHQWFWEVRYPGTRAWRRQVYVGTSATPATRRQDGGPIASRRERH